MHLNKWIFSYTANEVKHDQDHVGCQLNKPLATEGLYKHFQI